jgi:Predicted hydrolases or acyltransferases (alpha/beta hydrolase superfamily)
LEFGSGDTELIWAHGWGHNHKAFLSVAEGLGDGYRHVLVDFPGFGASPMPSEPWGTLDYAECLTAFLQSRPRTRRVWIGHSFGCRVGIRIAARHPGLLDGLVLVAAAGIPRPVSLLEKIRRAIRKKMFALGKMLARSEADREKLRNKFGSPDYRNAGALRPTFVKVVNENLSDDARAITLPVKLIYGETDSETPPVLGANFQKLMGKATLSVLPRFGHIDILSSGRFQLQKEIKDFLRSLS